MTKYNKFILLFILTLISCSKDKNLEDWQRQKDSENIAKIDAISGIYEGSVKLDNQTDSKQTMQIEIRAGSRILDNPSSGAIREATVDGRLSVLSDHLASTSFSHGFYDKMSNDIHLELEVNDRNNKKNIIDVIGQIENNEFNAIVENRDYPNTRKTILLKRVSEQDANSTKNAMKSLQPGHSQVSLFDFIGKLRDNFGNDQNAELIVMSSASTSEISLLDYFTPLKIVDATLNIGNGLVSIFFQNATWDADRGKLYGLRTVQTNGENNAMMIDCSEEDGWDCKYILNRVGVLYSGKLTPKFK